MAVQPRRQYGQGARAVSTKATRRRIIEAATALHATVGPAATTISAIAELAGVQRLTVYRHFPDEDALLDACVAHQDDVHPMPKARRWASGTTIDPVIRLEGALATLGAYYEETEPLLANLLRDAAIHPPTARRVAIHRRGLEDIADELEPGWTLDAGRAGVVRGAIGHALAFETWRSLRRDGGLSAEEVSDLLVGLVEAAAEPLA